MISRWFIKDQTQSQAETLFEALNAAARAPAFFTDAGVPDTTEGRFEVLGLHVFLVMRRLRRDAPASDRLSAALQEVFFRRLDDALREIGIGDLSIGRKIRGLAEAFYGRAAAYDKACSEGPDALARALARNVFESGELAQGRLLANYVLRADKRLAASSAENLAHTIASLGAVSEQAGGSSGDER